MKQAIHKYDDNIRVIPNIYFDTAILANLCHQPYDYLCTYQKKNCDGRVETFSKIFQFFRIKSFFFRYS